MKKQAKSNSVIVIGAGASGMMAAGRAAEIGAGVLLLEGTDRPGKKILISGNARCNLTNIKELENFIDMFGPNGRFLYRAFQRFFRDDLLAFLRRYGVETKVEPGGFIFPVSDNAGDVVIAFEKYLSEHNVQLDTDTRVTGIEIDQGRVAGVQAGPIRYPAAAVILAAGGASFPATGSAGDGYRLAKAVGHTITRLRPALVPLVVDEVGRAKSLQGTSLKKVRLTSFSCPVEEIDVSLIPDREWGRGIEGKKPSWPVIESRTGEMMITHFGLSGPVTLLMSLAIVDALESGPVSVSIDMKPDTSCEELRRRLQRDFDHYGKRSCPNILEGLLPPKMIPVLIEMADIPRDRIGCRITGEERDRLVSLIKSLRFGIKSPLSMNTAIVTAGGVSLKEIDPYTLESRLVKGLYFCGEVMDLDADTGGYNLQAAFSTGYVAGESAAGFVNSFP